MKIIVSLENEKAFKLAETAAKLAREAVTAQQAKQSSKLTVAGCIPPAFGSYDTYFLQKNFF